jgi:hypothetical protein
MKLATAVAKVLALAETIRDYWAVELPKRHPNYPLVDPAEDPGPSPPQEKTLRRLLGRLDEDTVYKLALIMYLGRGDFDTSDLAGDYQALRENFDGPADVISQMMEKAPLADYLTEGMTILEDQGLDLDKMDLSTTRAGK